MTDAAPEVELMGPEDPILLQVVRGCADDTEIAALTAVIAALSGSTLPVRNVRSSWADPARAVGAPLRAGPGGWRTSALPG